TSSLANPQSPMYTITVITKGVQTVKTFKKSDSE
ncbi:MAG: hypothetical protein ACI8ZA_002213, partial [Gammaproteobacteria bacterium]